MALALLTWLVWQSLPGHWAPYIHFSQIGQGLIQLAFGWVGGGGEPASLFFAIKESGCHSLSQLLRGWPGSGKGSWPQARSLGPSVTVRSSMHRPRQPFSVDTVHLRHGPEGTRRWWNGRGNVHQCLAGPLLAWLFGVEPSQLQPRTLLSWVECSSSGASGGPLDTRSTLFSLGCLDPSPTTVSHLTLSQGQ